MRQLEAMRQLLEEDVLGVDVARLVPDIPEPVLWQEHQALLAETLDTPDWYAVARAYDAIEVMRAIAAEADLIKSLDRDQQMWFAGYMTGPVVWDVNEGAQSLSRLAGAVSLTDEARASRRQGRTAIENLSRLRMEDHTSGAEQSGHS